MHQTRRSAERSRRVLFFRGSPLFWLRFLGLVAFAILLLRLPVLSKEVTLSHLDFRWLGLCMLLTIMQILMESLVWQRLLRVQHIRQPYAKTLLDYLASQYLGLVTPGHVGEFLAGGYISMDTGITMGYALSSVVMQKVIMWLIMAGFGIWSLPLLMQLPIEGDVRWEMIRRSIIVAVALSAGITVWVLSLRGLARRWRKLSPWQIDMTEFWAGWKRLLSPALIVPAAIAVVSFALVFFQFHAILRAAGILMPLTLAAHIAALSRIMGRLIPVSFLGFGTKDAAIIWLLAQHNIPSTMGLAVTLLWLVGSELLILLLSGLCWWVKPLVIKRTAPTTT